jgi:Zn-finger domain-containing protein
MKIETDLEIIKDMAEKREDENLDSPYRSGGILNLRSY